MSDDDTDDGEYSDDEAPDAPPKLGRVRGKEQTSLRVADATDKMRENWRASLYFNQEGGLTRDAGNAALILCHEEKWRGCVRLDEFGDRVRWYRDAPVLVGLPRPREGRQLDSQAVTYCQHWLRKLAGPAFTREAVKEGLLVAAQQNAFHPVREYLKSLRWDGTRRLDTWLSIYFGTEQDRYHAEVGRMWLVSAVARVMRPGCQADYLLVLEGEQGKKKSSALRVLGGEWTLEGLPDLRDQPRAASQIQGKWIVEIPELHAIKGQSVTLVKQWITTRVDSFRAAYAEFQQDKLRQCIFAATTNEERYLIDSTGGRRFWPVRCAHIDLVKLRADRDQLWAEALETFMGGEAVEWSPGAHGAWSWWPSDSDLELTGALATAQEARFDEDEWSARIGNWLIGKDAVTVGMILSGPLNVEPGKWTRPDQTRVGAILRRLGWRARQETRLGVRERWHYPPA